MIFAEYYAFEFNFVQILNIAILCLNLKLKKNQCTFQYITWISQERSTFQNQILHRQVAVRIYIIKSNCMKRIKSEIIDNRIIWKVIGRGFEVSTIAWWRLACSLKMSRFKSSTNKQHSILRRFVELRKKACLRKLTSFMSIMIITNFDSF